MVGWLLIYSLKRKFLRCLAVVVKRGIRNNKNYKALPFMHYFEDPPQIWIFKVQAVRHWLFSVHNIFEYGNICTIGWVQYILKNRFYKLWLSLSFDVFSCIKVIKILFISVTSCKPCNGNCNYIEFRICNYSTLRHVRTVSPYEWDYIDNSNDRVILSSSIYYGLSSNVCNVH